jgi:hypothetical protein
MRKLTTATIAGLAMCLAGSAHAASATYTTTGGEQTVTGNADFAASMQRGTSSVTASDGKGRTENWVCIGASNPPNSKVFDVHSVCDVTSAAGSYSINFGCQNFGKDGMQGCVGGLVGKTGIFAGKSGATTWAGTGGTGSGTMQWLN